MAASSVTCPFCHRSNSVTATSSVPGPTRSKGSATDCTVNRKTNSQQLASAAAMREPGAQARERHDESRGQTFSVSRNAAVKSRALSGFLAGVVRKKLGLTLQSEKTDGERVYRVIEPQPA
jgi:hypothetical protein